MSDTTSSHKPKLSVRITTKDRSLLNEVCKARGEDVSDFVRLAIRKELAALSFLPEEDKKALGIKVTSQNV